MSDWVDLQLAHQMAEVAAPEELWSRIETRPVRRRTAPRLLVATVAAVILAVVVSYSASQPHEVHRAAVNVTGSCQLCHTM